METTPHNQKSELSRKLARSNARRIFLSAISLIFSFLFSTASVAAPRHFVPGQILVKPKANVSEQKFADNLREKNAFHRRTIRKTNVRVVNVTEETAEAVLAALKNNPDIEFAERDYIATASFVPNDQYVTSGTEWHLAKIQATDAWNFTAGQSNIIVAVIDSGANNENPDLVGKLVAGYNFTMNDTNTTDDFGHGTAVAGTIAAAGNNGQIGRAHV